MKRIPLLAILISIILLGGCFVNSQDYDNETIEKAKEVAESYIKNNYQDIETVEFIGVEESPMGGMWVNGKVNGKAGFTIDMDEKVFKVMGAGLKEGFPELKEECKNGGCDY